MLTVELFAAMVAGTKVVLNGIPVVIQGMVKEDGSGKNWIVFANDVHLNDQLKFFVRSKDTGKFACIPLVE